MRDDQLRRYARHILVPDVGGLGQTAILVATARMEMRESEPDAEMIAAMYLVAGGVGTLAIRNTTDAQLAELAKRGADTSFVPSTPSTEVVLSPRPAWWPAAQGDALALAYWRGSIAATRWMAAIANE